MIARVSFFQGGLSDRRANVVFRDVNTSHQIKGYVWMKDKDGTINTKGQWIAAYCKSAALYPHPRLVVTIAPPNAHGWSEIQDVEPYDVLKKESA